MRRACTTALVSLAVAFAAAAQGSVEALVDQPTVRLGNGFAITVLITGSPVERIVLPDVDGLRIATTPFAQSTQFSFSGGVSESVAELKYQAVASKAGPMTIPPIKVTVGGTVFQSDPIEINVIDANQSRQDRPDMRQQEPQPEQPQEQLTVDDLCFLRAEAEKKTVYQGEGVPVTFEFWHLNSPRFNLGQPHIDLRQQQVPAVGFYVVDLGARQRNDVHRGYAYTVEEFRKVMYPTTTGDLTIGSFEFKGQASIYFQGGFGGVRRYQYDLATTPIPITVKPLPPRPEGFTGGVGSFTVSSIVSDNAVVAGEPTSFVLTVTGEGNPESFGAPVLPEIPNVHISDPEANVEMLSSKGDMAFEKQFTYQLTPRTTGTFTVPPISLAYFDPAKEDYVIEQTSPFEVEVTTPPEGQQRVVVDGAGQQVEERTSVEVTGRDLRPNVTDPGPIYPASRNWLFGFGSVLPPLAYLAMAAVMRRRRRFASDSRLARAHFAKSRGRKRLAEVPDARDPAEALYRALAGFIADKFNVPESGMTSHDAERLFKEANLDPELSAPMVKTLRACERARYGSGALSSQELNALIDATEVNMDRLEEAMRAGRTLL